MLLYKGCYTDIPFIIDSIEKTNADFIMSTSPVPSLTSDTSETAAPTRSFTTSTNKTQDFGTSLDAIQGTEADDTGVETLPASSTTVHTTYDESSGGDVTFVEDPNVEFQSMLMFIIVVIFSLILGLLQYFF